MGIPLSVRSFTDAGAKRSVNEDSLLVDEANGIFVLADGMGRYASGDRASRLAVQVTRDALLEQRDAFEALRRMDGPGVRARARKAMELAIQKACGRIHDEARDDPTHREMGTTCDAVVVVDSLAFVGHVGDGRVWQVRGSETHLLTEDHTLAAAQVKAGLLAPEAVDNSPLRKVLVRSLGLQPSVEVDTLCVECQEGDAIALSTDGLWRAFPAGELEKLLRDPPALDLRQLLAQKAAFYGCTDNMTAIALHFGQPRAQTEESLAAGKLAALQRVPLFAGLDYRELSDVMAVGEMRPAAPGAIIMREGDAGHDMFVVVRGRVAVEARGTPLAELGAGAHFGEMAIIDDAPRSATVRALEDSKLLRFSRDELFGLMRRQPTLGLKLSWQFVHSLAGRLRAANENVSRSSVFVALPTPAAAPQGPSTIRRGPYAR